MALSLTLTPFRHTGSLFRHSIGDDNLQCNAGFNVAVGVINDQQPPPDDSPHTLRTQNKLPGKNKSTCQNRRVFAPARLPCAQSGRQRPATMGEARSAVVGQSSIAQTNLGRVSTRATTHQPQLPPTILTALSGWLGVGMTPQKETTLLAGWWRKAWFLSRCDIDSWQAFSCRSTDRSMLCSHQTISACPLTLVIGFEPS